MTPEPTPTRPPPHPMAPVPMVGGSCSYFSHAGTYTVTKVGPGGVHFAFHLPAGEPTTWGGKPDTDGMSQNVARFEGDLVGSPSASPAVGAVFPGVRKEEVHGTCTPWGYSVSIGGAELDLAPES
jgi:hypothetical protein